MGWKDGQGVGPRQSRKRKQPTPSEPKRVFTVELPPHLMASMGSSGDQDEEDEEGDDEQLSKFQFAPKNTQIYTGIFFVIVAVWIFAYSPLFYPSEQERRCFWYRI
jgi:hypothetical protein